MKNHVFRVERYSAVGVYRIMSAALDLYRTSFPPILSEMAMISA